MLHFWPVGTFTSGRARTRAHRAAFQPPCGQLEPPIIHVAQDKVTPRGSPTPLPASHERPTALILGLGVHGLAVARSLGRKGVVVEVADCDTRQPHCYSRYCRRLHEVSSLDDERLVEFLVRFGQARRHSTALFITMDKSVPVISAHRDVLSEHFTFNLPSDSVIRELMDKTRLPGFLKRCEALQPKTSWIQGPEDLAIVAGAVGFPCVVKPARRTYGFKAGIAHSTGELEALYATSSRHIDTVVVQEWIPGGDSEVYFCFAYIGRDFNPRGVFVGHKLRQYPSGTGIAASAEGCDNEFVRHESLRLFRLAGYTGFGSTEFRRNPANGRYYLIEFTVGRTDYNVACAVANGVDLPFIGYCDMVGQVPDSTPPRQQNGRRWVDLGRDTQAILQEAAGVWRLQAASVLARSLSPWNVYTLFDIRDPGPFLMHAVTRVLSAPRAIVRRTMRSIRGAR